MPGKLRARCNPRLENFPVSEEFSNCRRSREGSQGKNRLPLRLLTRGTGSWGSGLSLGTELEVTFWGRKDSLWTLNLASFLVAEEGEKQKK